MAWWSRALIVMALVISACAAPSSQSQPGIGSPATLVQSGTDRAAGPKILRVGRQGEPSTIEGFTGQGGRGGGAGDIRYFLHAHLTDPDPNDNNVPRLATELPAVDSGTWRANADGTMDVTWRLRPNVTWHDGVPFTSGDLAFAFALHKDPELPTAYASVLRFMTGVETPDDNTFVVHWSRIDAKALAADGLTPMPRHLLEEAYRSDRANFANHPRFTTEWVGLGPYRLVKWELGSHMELARHEAFFLGRPAFDSVIIRFFFDARALAASTLAEAVEVVLPPGIELDTAVEIRDRWKGTGNVVRFESIPRLADLEVQFRPEVARPVVGLRERQIRQAFFQAINREELAGVMTLGLAPVADSWLRPGDPLRAQIEPSLPKYAYDPTAAVRLLAEAGWVRRPDGALVHQASGELFESEMLSIPQYGERPAVVLADNWKAIGADIRIFVVPPARQEERELSSTFSFVRVTGSFMDQMAERLDGRLISAADNRWTGRNQSGYASARYDQNLDRLANTFDPRERLPLLREQQQILMGDLARLPLYWEVRAVFVLKGLAGDIYPYNPAWNLHEWNKYS